jgi:pyrimidine operon attenuation protein/uracil phosphoribosyltransferase
MADPRPQDTLPDAGQIAREIADLGQRLSARIATGQGPVALIGIERGGAVIARALQAHLPADVAHGALDPSFHRDDYATRGLRTARPSAMPLSLEGYRVILVDDVLHTGRTVRAALEALFERGRVASVCLAVLVDRPGRELPLQADEVGFRLDLPAGCRVKVIEDPQLRLELETRA